MRINSESFGAESSFYTWLDEEIQRFRRQNYSFRAFPGIRIAKTTGIFREGGNNKFVQISMKVLMWEGGK